MTSALGRVIAHPIRRDRAIGATRLGGMARSGRPLCGIIFQCDGSTQVAKCRWREGQVDRSERRRGRGHERPRLHRLPVGHRGSEQPPFWMDRFSLYIGGYNVTEAWRGTKSSSAYRRGLAFGCVRADDRRRNHSFFSRQDRYVQSFIIEWIMRLDFVLNSVDLYKFNPVALSCPQ